VERGEGDAKKEAYKALLFRKKKKDVRTSRNSVDKSGSLSAIALSKRLVKRRGSDDLIITGAS